MRSRWSSLSYHLRWVRPDQAEWSEVMKDPEGREGKTRDRRADQGEVRTEELGRGGGFHAMSVDARPSRAMTETS
jgi:hypothetical protein